MLCFEWWQLGCGFRFVMLVSMATTKPGLMRISLSGKVRWTRHDDWVQNSVMLFIIQMGWITKNRRWHDSQFVGSVLNQDGLKSTQMVLERGYAVAGGSIQDENGVWQSGFARNIGICIIIEVELWGMYNR